MLIPDSISTNVISKNVVYKDEILPIRKNDRNFRITKVSGVSLNDLENCVKAVLGSNSSSIFYTVQYSNKDKAVYFYTNESISTKTWLDLKKFNYKVLFTSEDVAKEIQRLFDSPQDTDVKNINLYDLKNYMKKKNYEYEEAKNNFQERLNRKIKARYGINNHIFIYEFDYQSMEMSISVNDTKISFIKKNGDLFISKDESIYTDFVMNTLGNDLFELYDFFMKNANYKNQNSFDIPTVNSCFKADISSYGVAIFSRYADNQKQFKISAPSYTKGYTHYMYSPYIDDVLGNDEDKLFRQIVVKIDDCPKWCQKELYEERLLELENQRVRNDEIVLRRTRRQRRDEIKRKLFPFLKK